MRYYSTTLIFVFIYCTQLNAQVGIGTNTPDNSAMLQVQSTEKGFLLPQMSSAQRTAIVAPANGLQVYDTNSNSIWFFNGTFWVNTQAMASVGDVKSGIQIADHSGWVLLDGRPLTALSANQQAVATAVGLSGNLPDASNAYLSQNGNPMATISGANTTALTQANLPNVSFTGTAASAGGHNHGGVTGDSGEHNHTGTTSTNGNHNHTGTTNNSGGHSHSVGLSTLNGWPGGVPNAFKMNMTGFSSENNVATTDRGANMGYTDTGIIGSAGDHSHSLNINNNGDHNHTFTTNTVSDHNHSISTDGAHTHSVTVSSGGSATPISIAPQTLSVNMFIYLGL